MTKDEETAKYQVRYYYENEEYTAEFDGFTVYGSKAIIYIDRYCPENIKEFIPKPALSTESAWACFFIALFIILIEYVLFFA